MQDEAAGTESAPETAEEGGDGAKRTVGGLGANLVSTMRSFLPFVSKQQAEGSAVPAAGKKPVKVRAKSLTAWWMILRASQSIPFVSCRQAACSSMRQHCRQNLFMKGCEQLLVAWLMLPGKECYTKAVLSSVAWSCSRA